MTERTYKKDLEVINLVSKSFIIFTEDLTLKNYILRLSISPLNRPHRIFIDFIKPSSIKISSKLSRWGAENMWKSKMTESWVKLKKLRQWDSPSSGSKMNHFQEGASHSTLINSSTFLFLAFLTSPASSMYTYPLYLPSIHTLYTLYTWPQYPPSIHNTLYTDL